MRILFYILSLFILTTTTVAATIYKSVDENGNVVFTDKPGGKAEKVVPPESTIIKSTPTKTTQNQSSNTSKQNSIVTSYQNIRIANPSNDMSIRENNGNVTVTMEITPPLDITSGHKIALFLDGKQGGTTQSLTFVFNNLDRGTHELRAAIIDRKGKILKQSNSITFYLHRFSILHH